MGYFLCLTGNLLVQRLFGWNFDDSNMHSAVRVLFQRNISTIAFAYTNYYIHIITLILYLAEDVY